MLRWALLVALGAVARQSAAAPSASPEPAAAAALAAAMEARERPGPGPGQVGPVCRHAGPGPAARWRAGRGLPRWASLNFNFNPPRRALLLMCYNVRR